MHESGDTRSYTRLDLANAVDRELLRIAQGAPGVEAERAQEELLKRHEGTLHRTVACMGSKGDAEVLRTARHALRRAARTFDAERAGSFVAYATARVRDAVRTHGAPRRANPNEGLRAGRFLQVRITASSMSDDLHRSPSLDELADELGYTPSDVLDALAVRSAERVRTTQLAAALAGSATPDVTGAISELDERTRLVLYRLVCEGRSRREVANELGVSTFDVHDLERRGRLRVAQAAG